MVRQMLRQWFKKVIWSFVLCLIIISGFSILISRYSLTEKYMLVAMLLCAGYYLYQIFLVVRIRCPRCKKPVIFSLYTRKISLNLDSFKSCNFCGEKFN